ncbi:cupin domain-containing protein [Oscillatoria sp. FACHB-1407]|uniref:cupin domain-containing protein n=1 Tax=Oscillatoria sp. FACHB-1407 TaxID=2692847 RepID=UPI001688BECC|nr:cupin domain-containing protein [Oscillatoria sp. FACHB-1407]MBD2462510.1 cupin domain-containing protein [Oscillatoria sp. FACHB-1407]
MSQALRSPKLLMPGEGESFQMANLTFTQKISQHNTQNQWVMHEIMGKLNDEAPLHSHPWTETFYIIEGELDVQVGNRKALAVPGTVMYVPENVAHSFRIRSATARLLEMIPASAEGFYREAGEKAPSLPAGIDAFLATCDKYHIRLF